MRIAIFVHCFYPTHVYGTEAYTLLLAKNLKELGHEPTIVSAVFLGERRQDRAVESYIWDGIKVVSVDKNAFPHGSLSETYYQPSQRNLQERILRGINPDIVHITHLINHGASIIEVANSLGVPVVSTLTDFFGFCYNNKLETAFGRLCNGPNALRSNCISCYVKDVARYDWASQHIRRLNRPISRRVGPHLIGASKLLRGASDSADEFDAVVKRPNVLLQYYRGIAAAIAPSSFLMEAYQKNMPMLPVRLSHFGIDIDRTPKPARLHHSALVFGFVGQIAPHKGVHLLLEAFRELGAGCRLDIYGDVRQDEAYVARLREMAGGLNVRFCGTFPAAETVRVMESLDVMVIPSTWYENSPLILLQSLATHTPCIVSDVKGMTEFVRDGVSGFHFRRGDVTSLKAVMKRFVEDPELAARMSTGTSYERTALDMAKDAIEIHRSALVLQRNPEDRAYTA